MNEIGEGLRVVGLDEFADDKGRGRVGWRITSEVLCGE